MTLASGRPHSKPPALTSTTDNRDADELASMGIVNKSRHEFPS